MAIKSIMVIRLGRIGDVLLTGPTVKNLKFTFPDSRIIFLTREMYKELADMLPGVDNVLTFPNEGGYFDLLSLSSAVEDFQPDLAVDLHKNFRSFHLVNLSKAPYKVVYKKRRKQRTAAVTEKKFRRKVPHTIDLYNRVIKQLNGVKLARRPDVTVPYEVLFEEGAFRDGVAIVPGASSAVKMWPAARFAAVAERLMYDFNSDVHLFLSNQEKELQEAFARLPEEKLHFHIGASFPEISAVLAHCRLAVTNDSGLMHLSSSVGTPTAGIFGPTHRQLGFFPHGIHDRLISVDEHCRPCSLHGDKACYRDEQYCFTRLTVDVAYDTIADMMDRIKLPPAVFIDRDGTLIVDKHYLADPQKIEFEPGALEAVRAFKKAGYMIVIVTNQSAVARGFYTKETVDLVHQHLVELMRQNDCEPDDIRYCPHHTDGDIPEYTGACYCRKPRAGMLEDAAQALGIDLKRSFMIGDKLTDIHTGKVAGTQTILVRSGKGKETEQNLPKDQFLCPDQVADSLGAAARLIPQAK